MAASSRLTAAQTIGTIAWHEFVTNVRRPGFIFFTLLIPALGVIGLIIAAFFSGQASDFLEDQFGGAADLPVGLVDQSGLYGELPPEYQSQYRLYPDPDSAQRALLDKELSGYIVIHPDYLETGDLTAYSTGGFFDAVNVGDSGRLRAFLVRGLLGEEVDPQLVERAADPSNVAMVTLDENGQPTTDGNPLASVAGFIIPYILSIFLIISIFTASSYLLRSVSEEKETRVIEVVLSSVPATQLLTGKVIGLGVLGLTQMGVWLISSFLLTGGITAVAATVVVALNPVAFALSALYFLLGYLLYGTLMAVAGALGTSNRESQQLASVFSVAASVPLMFNSLILTGPDSALARGLSYFPLTAPTTMMLRLPLTPSLPWLDIAISIGGLFITIPLVLWAGAKVFRMGLLLYGKRPGVKQILQAMRAA